jgi:hypothetical protein
MHLINDVEPGSRPDIWGQKFAAYKPQKHLPVVPQATRLAIRDSSALITSAVLIGSETPRTDPFDEVTICPADLSGVDFHGVPIQLV